MTYVLDLVSLVARLLKHGSVNGGRLRRSECKDLLSDRLVEDERSAEDAIQSVKHITPDLLLKLSLRIAMKSAHTSEGSSASST